MTTTGKRTYTHDCDKCEFLEIFEDSEGKLYDMYRCPGDTGYTYLARSGNNKQDYWSMAYAVLRRINPGPGSELMKIMWKKAREYETRDVKE